MRILLSILREMADLPGDVEALARANSNVQLHTAGKTIAKVVIVPGRKLVSIVAK